MSFENKTIVSSDPPLSVVMAVYNSGKYLRESIDSVLLQTYPYFEFILVNDGSTDESEDIIQEYIKKDRRIVYLKNDVNSGQSKTRNKAIRSAKGNFIAIVDSDDICLADRFEKQVFFLKENPAVDVLGSSYCMFLNNRGDKCETIVSADVNDLRNGTPPVHNPTCMIKQKTFLKYGYYDSKYDNAEDYELWLRWFSQGVCFENIPEVLYKKRTHSGSVSISNIKRQIYLMLKINFMAITKYHIRFTLRGYVHIFEQFLYLIYLYLGLNKIYAKGESVK